MSGERYLLDTDAIVCLPRGGTILWRGLRGLSSAIFLSLLGG
jgi:hypothetical protein